MTLSVRWISLAVLCFLSFFAPSGAIRYGGSDQYSMDLGRRRTRPSRRVDDMQPGDADTDESYEQLTERFTRKAIPRAGVISFGRVEPVSYSKHSVYDDDEDEELRLQQQIRKSGYRPWQPGPEKRSIGEYSLTSKLTLINFAAYALQVVNPAFTQWGVKLSERILQGQDLYRLFTPMFLHGGIAHLLTNTFSLGAVGPDVERYFGNGRFIATYLAAGVAGNLASAVKSPNPALGASGAVFGVVGAYLVFLHRNKQFFGSQGDYMQQNLVQTIGINLFMGVINPYVDNWGHIGGALGGAAMSYYFGPRLYMAGLPNGGRMLVDKPVIRLPRSIESIPEQFFERFDVVKSKVTRRMQVERFKADLPVKPWRPKGKVSYPRKLPPGPVRSLRPLKSQPTQ